VFLVPACIFLFLGIHLFLVMYHGISEPPKPGVLVNRKTYRADYEERMKKHGHPFWPDAMWRDVVFGVATLAVIALCAAFLGPPELGKPPNPASIDADPKPDWYLLWLFAALALMPPKLEDLVILGAPLVIGGVLLIVPLISKSGERSPRRRPWAVAAAVFCVMMVGALWIEGYRSKWSPNFQAEPLSAEVVGATSGPIADGARYFHAKGCLNCHLIDGYGGRRGPDLSHIGSLLTKENLTLRIINGGTNMPAFAGNMSPEELSALVAFLESRTTKMPGPMQATDSH
jgi:ubiquinol-cytochrome c reductase cytochrome b subunit